ncbi:MAG: hypothetical protein Q9198_001340 [Flavoplaca austrocitrina]
MLNGTGRTYTPHVVSCHSQAASIAPTGVQKRGWPKGKPRKGRNSRVTRSSTKGKAEQPEFPFMDLPLKIRREIYSLVLPQQTPQSRSNGWATMDGLPNEFMNLLAVNKQVSDEARGVLYELNIFTMVISDTNSLVLGYLDKVSFKPMQSPPSLPYIKNWQIALWPEIQDLMYPEIEQSAFSDAVISACFNLAKSPGLQTLKIAIPCLCEWFAEELVCDCTNGRCKRPSIEDIHDEFIAILTPFNHLRFTGKVKIATTPKPPQEWDMIHWWRNDHPPTAGNIAAYTELANHAHPQCQHPACLSFAESFIAIATTLMGKTTPLAFTDRHTSWFELKERAALAESQYSRPIDLAPANYEERLSSINRKQGTARWHHNVAKTRLEQDRMQYDIVEARQALPLALCGLWRASDSKTEEYYEAMSDRLLEVLDKLPNVEEIERRKSFGWIMPENIKFDKADDRV